MATTPENAFRRGYRWGVVARAAEWAEHGPASGAFLKEGSALNSAPPPPRLVHVQYGWGGTRLGGTSVLSIAQVTGHLFRQVAGHLFFRGVGPSTRDPLPPRTKRDTTEHPPLWRMSSMGGVEPALAGHRY